MIQERIKAYEEFYKFYLAKHSNKTNRLLHVIGSTIVLAIAFTAIYHRMFELFLLMPIVGYGFAWVGHSFFEKSTPPTLKYPLWSLKSDFKMYFDILGGKLSLDTSKDASYEF